MNKVLTIDYFFPKKPNLNEIIDALNKELKYYEMINTNPILIIYNNNLYKIGYNLIRGSYEIYLELQE